MTASYRGTCNDHHPGSIVASECSRTNSLNPADEDGRIRGNVRNYTAPRAKQTKKKIQKRHCRDLKSGKN